jgi:anaerobic ribonucleoside-triphosphate reductase activating protein
MVQMFSVPLGHLNITRFSPQCRVLGPGLRAVLWVQGCPLSCNGCVVPETQPFELNELVGIEELAHRIAQIPEITGITLSGGEPFSQALGLSQLLDFLCKNRSLSAMAYSGFKIEALKRGTSDQLALLERLDILVDGPYIESQHEDLLWRGSRNQRIHFLSPRYKHLQEQVQGTPSCGLEFEVVDETMAWSGVPPKGFRAEFDRQIGLLRGSGD